MKDWTFHIPGVFPGLNEYIRVERGKAGRYRAAALKKSETERVAWLALAAAFPGDPEGASPMFRKPCRIIIHWFSPNQRRDVDNIRFAAKFILDGLVIAGVLIDDSQKYIRGITDVFRVDKDNPRVVVMVEEVE